MPSHSYWHILHRSPVVESDLAIIGGGICGLSASNHAADAGLSVVLLEAEAVGYGASGRNAGYLMRGAADNYAAAVRDWGRARAAEIWRLSERSLSWLKQIGVEEVAGTMRCPSCLVAYEPSEAADVEASAALLAEDGFGCELVQPRTDEEPFLREHGGALIGLVNPNDLTCDSVAVLRHLSARAAESGVRVMVGHRAEELMPLDDGRVEVLTPSGVVRARRVLCCLNAFSRALIPGIGERVAPNRGQMFAARTGLRLSRAYYMNRGSEYIRTSHDGMLLVGGCRNRAEAAERTMDDSPTDFIQQELERFARDKLDVEFEVIHRWAGTMGFTADGLPLFERCETPGVWLCAGFNGHGMSLAPAYAELAVRRLKEEMA
ncbi:MAG: FAD-dependent oxidoreductase [Planctomycetota bacterium]